MKRPINKIDDPKSGIIPTKKMKRPSKYNAISDRIVDIENRQPPLSSQEVVSLAEGMEDLTYEMIEQLRREHPQLFLSMLAFHSPGDNLDAFWAWLSASASTEIQKLNKYDLLNIEQQCPGWIKKISEIAIKTHGSTVLFDTALSALQPALSSLSVSDIAQVEQRCPGTILALIDASKNGCKSGLDALVSIIRKASDREKITLIIGYPEVINPVISCTANQQGDDLISSVMHRVIWEGILPSVELCDNPQDVLKMVKYLSALIHNLASDHLDRVAHNTDLQALPYTLYGVQQVHARINLTHEELECWNQSTMLMGQWLDIFERQMPTKDISGQLFDHARQKLFVMGSYRSQLEIRPSMISMIQRHQQNFDQIDLKVCPDKAKAVLSDIDAIVGNIPDQTDDKQIQQIRGWLGDARQRLKHAQDSSEILRDLEPILDDETIQYLQSLEVASPSTDHISSDELSSKRNVTWGKNQYKTTTDIDKLLDRRYDAGLQKENRADDNTSEITNTPIRG